jgi:hypothetical protein
MYAGMDWFPLRSSKHPADEVDEGEGHSHKQPDH